MYRRCSARPLQMWFRYCRAKELVWKAWEHYGRRYCEADEEDDIAHSMLVNKFLELCGGVETLLAQDTKKDTGTGDLK